MVGPVTNVYQAKNANGSPVFIDLGYATSKKHSFTIVVWGSDLRGSFA